MHPGMRSAVLSGASMMGLVSLRITSGSLCRMPPSPVAWSTNKICTHHHQRECSGSAQPCCTVTPNHRRTLRSQWPMMVTSGGTRGGCERRT